MPGRAVYELWASSQCCCEFVSTGRQVIAVWAAITKYIIYNVWHLYELQAEDGDGETPLGAAAQHGKMREALVAVSTGALDISHALQT